jgi:hypothetical protein
LTPLLSPFSIALFCPDLGPPQEVLEGSDGLGSGLGGTLGPWFSGFLFDRTGSYALSFSLSMAVLILATVCAWLAGRWGGAQASMYR